MEAGKVLVVYYSRTGTTRAVAEAVAAELGADTEEIVDRKDRAGVLGGLAAGKDAMLKKPTEINEPKRAPASYDLVLIGTPVWAWTMCPAVRAYLTQFKDRFRRVGFFLTTGGTGADRTFRHMQEICGKAPVAELALTAGEVKRSAYLDKVKAFAAKCSAPRE